MYTRFAVLVNFLYISWDADVLTVFYAWNKTYLHALVTSYHSIFSSRDIQHDLNPSFSFLFFIFYASVLAVVVAGGIMCLVCPSHSCERDISKTPWGNFFKFGANVHLDSSMNWFDFGGQWVKGHWDRTRNISGHHSTIGMLITTRFKAQVCWDKTTIWSHFIHKKVECQHHCDVNVLPII